MTSVSYYQLKHPYVCTENDVGIICVFYNRQLQFNETQDERIATSRGLPADWNVFNSL